MYGAVAEVAPSSLNSGSELIGEGRGECRVWQHVIHMYVHSV